MGAAEDYVRLLPRALALSACFFPVALPAVAAGSYCSAPSQPFCLSGSSGFADDREAASCRAQLEAYLSAIERRANCLLSVAEEEARQRIQEGRREADEVRDEGRKAAARFECKARGGTCY
jgi:hypothetical protein